MKPQISIIVPVYNVDQYLRSCLESILNQSFTDFEVILINDGSTDESGDICDEYAASDQRINVVHQPFGGVSSARNTGINLARSNYIGFVDSDDRIEKNMYQMLYQNCIETNSQIGVCKLGREINGKIVNQDIGSFYTKTFSNELAMKELFKGELYRFSLCNKLFEKSCFINIKFPDGRIHEDLSTTYRLFARAKQVVYINEIGYIYVKRVSSILTSTYNRKRLDSFIGWNEILPYMDEKYNQISNVVYACFAYWCIDNMNYTLIQVSDKKERLTYLKIIQGYIRQHYVKIMKDTLLSRKHKQMISFFCLPSRFITNRYKFNNTSNEVSVGEKLI